MHDTAAHLVDRVIPQVPVRQWVLSLSRWARFLPARDPQLITRTLDVALRAIFAHQRLRARHAGALAPRVGAVTFVQRFGGALSLSRRRVRAPAPPRDAGSAAARPPIPLRGAGAARAVFQPTSWWTPARSL